MTRELRRSMWILLAIGTCCVVALTAAWADERAARSSSAAQHWSFQKLDRPKIPPASDTRWVRNPIDHFVLARLDRHGIAPSPEADRVTLIRRLKLDLLGLPPTPDEVDQFVGDTGHDAYEQLVDRLLASPHYGERWGRYWLDLARYADSDGYEKDSPRPYAYLFRDWVIDAINRDMPFDRFTLEQIAGDLLDPGPEESAESSLARKIATGFHRNTLTNKEGGVDQEEFRNKANVDRVNTTSTVWLGLTLACSECHDHKYDPLTQVEYYQMFSFFNRSQETDLPAAQPAEQAAYESAKQAYETQQARLRKEMEDFERDELPARLAEWEKNLGGRVPNTRWMNLRPREMTSTGGAELAAQPDGSIVVSGNSPATATYSVTVDVRSQELAGITAFRLEVLPVEGHPAKGPGRVKHGNFVLNEFSVKVGIAENSAPQPVALKNAAADFSQDRYGVAGAIDGNPGTGWAIAPRFGERHTAVFETKETLSPGDATTAMRLVFTLDQLYGTEHTIGRFRISATSEPCPVAADDTPDAVLAAFQVPPSERDEQQKSAILKYYRSIDAEWKKRNVTLAEHTKKVPPPPPTKAMTLAENSSPPATHVHMRGDFLRKGDTVEPGTPAVLAATVPFKPRSSAGDRYDFARWLTDPSHPLTARVAVNRIWQNLFGKGLVATPDDFGTRGEPPSHPELLDWLATEFMARGWSQKEMIRLIVRSATYRQSSHARPELEDRDPANRLLARQNRNRLEAEIVRDVSLAASGLLSARVGGPSVRPPQPAGVSELTYAGSAKWPESAGSDRYRRGLYTWFQRTSPYPMLMTFDSPDGVNCTVRRERTNSPLQALTLLNDTVFLECAQGLARRVLNGMPGAEAGDRIRFAFRLCMAREPTESEAAQLADLLRAFETSYRNSENAAVQLAGSSQSGAAAPAELAAWTALARTMMNLDEFITRD